MKSQRGVTSIFNILAVIGILVVALIVGGAAYAGGKSDARDAQRAADIYRIIESLNNYHIENNRFPDVAQNRPVGLEQYLDRWPEPPQPADGTCLLDQNRYVYSTYNNGTSFSLSFCLGGKSGRFKAGPQTIKAP